MLEAQCRALEFPEENHTFFFSTEDGAFLTILTSNCENNAISYHRVKRMLIEKYSGEEYERHLETKFRNLKDRAHKRIPKPFINLDLLRSIRDYYGLTSWDQTNHVGMNHILSS